MASEKKLIILLPPSEGKAESGKTGTKFAETSGVFGKSLGKQRTSVVAALKQARGGSPKLLGVSGAHLTRAQQANLAVHGAKSLPASQRYFAASRAAKNCRQKHRHRFWIAWSSSGR
jgi:hypothetical protein